MTILTPQESATLEKAIIFLADNLKRTGHSTKPVLLHSVRVASRLLDASCSMKVVCAALLHDVLEDTDVTYQEVMREFGEGVAVLVQANTFDKSIANSEEKYKELFARTLMAGEDGLLVKAADLYDNSFYYQFSENPEQKRHLINKLGYFVDLARPLLNGSAPYIALVGRYNVLKAE